MRAVLCRQYGPPERLVIEDVPQPKAGAGQVVVSTKACGVNFPDTLIIQGKYQTKPALLPRWRDRRYRQGNRRRRDPV